MREQTKQQMNGKKTKNIKNASVADMADRTALSICLE